MDIAEINPFIRYARRHKYLYKQPHYSICRDCRLFYIQNGYGTIDIGGQEYNFSKGTAIYLPFGTKYRFNPAPDQDKMRLLIFNFDLTHIHRALDTPLATLTEENFSAELILNTPYPKEFGVAMVKTAPQVENTLLQCIMEYFNEGPLFREVGSACLKQCLTLLLREQTHLQNASLVQHVVAYVEEHFGDATLQNSKIAEHFGYHPYYLGSLFKQSTGYSLHSFLIRHRIQMAKNYLLTTNLNVNTICWKCGFTSEPFFIKTFKEQTGTTPKKYRNEWIVSNL